MALVKAFSRRAKRIMLGSSLLVTLLMGACGDNQTATTQPDATTAAATTQAVSAANGGPAITTVTAKESPKTESVLIPNVPGATEIALNQATLKELQGVIPDVNIKVFASQAEAKTLADNYHKTLSAASYNAEIPLTTEQEPGSFMGLYNTGKRKLIINVAPVKGIDSLQDGLSGLSEFSAKELLEQLKGKKSVVMIAALPEDLTGFFDEATPKAVTTVAAITTQPTSRATTPSATKPGANGASLPDYPGSTALELDVATQKAISSRMGDPRAFNGSYKTFVTSDDYEKATSFYHKLLLDQGYTRSAEFSNGALIFEMARFEYSKGQQRQVVFAIQLLKDFGVKDLTKDIPALEGKVKVGDTVLVLIGGEK